MSLPGESRRWLLLFPSLLAALLFTPVITTAQAVLRETPILENLTRNAVFLPQENGNTLNLVDNTSTTTLPEQIPTAYCHFISLNNYSPQGPFLQFALEALAATQLAIEHLNTGNGTVIPAVQGLNERCPIRFTAEYIDTQGMENVAVDESIPILQRQQSNTEENTNLPPCAFMGPFYSQVAVATALLTSLKEFPQFSPLATAIQLDNKETFPFFGRFTSPSAEFGGPLLDFLANTLQIGHFAVLHSDAGPDLSYVAGIRKAIQENEGEIQMQSFGFNNAQQTGSEHDYTATLGALKKTGYRYIFFLLNSEYFEQVLQEAFRLGIVGKDTGYTWIAASLSGPQQAFLDVDEHEPDSVLAKIGGGMLSYDVTRRGSLPGYGNFDVFQAAWRDLSNDESDLEYLESKVPKTLLEANPSRQYFTNETFEAGFDASAVFYDVAIGLGLTACQAQNDVPNQTPFLTGPNHYEYMLNNSFEGASGPIVLDSITGSRDALSMYFQITNIIPHKLPNGNITYTSAKTHFFGGEWIEMTPIVFSTNSTDIPLDLPPQEIDNNSISIGLRATGLTMSAVVMLTSAGLALWTQKQRKSRVVMASQPVFLLIICFGTFLMGASIVPKSLDDEVVSDDGADACCVTFPWLLAMGWCFAFSALFSKTYRINRIFHNPSFKRVKIKAKDVMWPMLVLLGCNILILSLWTALDPLAWERYVVGYDTFGRPNETRGQCSSDDWLPYLISLGVVNIGVLIVSIYEAWVARKISLEFAESEWIARVMNTIMMVTFVGIPVLVIAHEDPRVFYFVFVALIFAICMSLLVFIFVPKILRNRKMEKSNTKAAIQDTLRNFKRNNDTRSTSDDPSGDINRSTNTDTSDNDVSSREGAKVLMHPVLEERKAEEMRSLKKEKNHLKSMISDMKRKSVAMAPLITKDYNADELETLPENDNDKQEDSHEIEEDMEQLSNNMDHMLEELTEKQTLLEENDKLKEQVEEQKRRLDEEKQKLLDTNKKLQQQLAREDQKLEDETRKLDTVCE